MTQEETRAAGTNRLPQPGSKCTPSEPIATLPPQPRPLAQDPRLALKRPQRGTQEALSAAREAALAIRDRILGLRRVPAAELRANPKNWRRHPETQARALRALMGEVGWAEAVLAHETPEGLELIDGHLRVLQAEEGSEVPVLLDVSGEEADLLLAALDPIGAMAKTGEEALTESRPEPGSICSTPSSARTCATLTPWRASTRRWSMRTSTPGSTPRQRNRPPSLSDSGPSSRTRSV